MPREKLLRNVNPVIQELRKVGSMHYAIFAFKANYTPEYFKRAILPVLLNLFPCLYFDKNTKNIYWDCKDEDEVREAEKEADEFFERLESARPVSG